MTVADLLKKQGQGILADKIVKSRLIALDSKHGKILFDTHKNKHEHVEKFMNGKVTCMWASFREIKYIWGNRAEPVIECYVLHDSWKGDEE